MDLRARNFEPMPAIFSGIRLLYKLVSSVYRVFHHLTVSIIPTQNVQTVLFFLNRQAGPWALLWYAARRVNLSGHFWGPQKSFCFRSFSALLHTVVTSLLMVAGSPQAEALGKTGSELVESVSDMVKKLGFGRGPKPTEVAEFDAFFKRVALKLVNFCTKTVNLAAGTKHAGIGSFAVKSKKLVGRPALQAWWDEAESAFDNDASSLSLDKFKVLKQYKWVLSTEQVEKFNKMIGHVGAQSVKGALQDGCATDCKAIIPSRAGAASLSTSVQAGPVPPKLLKRAASSQAEKSAKMMKFFMPPTK